MVSDSNGGAYGYLNRTLDSKEAFFTKPVSGSDRGKPEALGVQLVGGQWPQRIRVLNAKRLPPFMYDDHPRSRSPEPEGTQWLGVKWLEANPSIEPGSISLGSLVRVGNAPSEGENASVRPSQIDLWDVPGGGATLVASWTRSDESRLSLEFLAKPYNGIFVAVDSAACIAADGTLRRVLCDGFRVRELHTRIPDVTVSNEATRRVSWNAAGV